MVELSEAPAERPSKWQCCSSRRWHGCHVADLHFSWTLTWPMPPRCKQGSAGWKPNRV